jgi:hypothetical protein
MFVPVEAAKTHRAGTLHTPTPLDHYRGFAFKALFRS